MSHAVREIKDLPHTGDCLDTLCPACGCCAHCPDDDHCEGTPGCAWASCGCAL